VFVVSRQSRFVAENVFCSSLFLAILSEGLLQVLEKQNPPLLCFSKRNSRWYFLFCVRVLFSKTTEKEMGKTSVKPERETVASEDARENER
jgi:hypothetical protein